ncbi:uncharacterized protein LOC144824355 [Lissotriton helveticus]
MLCSYVTDACHLVLVNKALPNTEGPSPRRQPHWSNMSRGVSLQRCAPLCTEWFRYAALLQFEYLKHTSEHSENFLKGSQAVYFKSSSISVTELISSTRANNQNISWKVARRYTSRADISLLQNCCQFFITRSHVANCVSQQHRDDFYTRN